MKRNAILAITSVISILLSIFHLADDVRRGYELGGFTNVRGMLMMVVWLYGAVMLRGRRSGYVIVVLGSLLGTIISLAHMMGKGLVGGRVPGYTGVWFWVVTVLVLQVSSVFSLILAARGLWNPQWGGGQVGVEIEPKNIETRPAIRSGSTAEPPLYGMCCISISAVIRSSSAARCGGLPVPTDA